MFLGYPRPNPEAFKNAPLIKPDETRLQNFIS
jgi:hypothetical protein